MDKNIPQEPGLYFGKSGEHYVWWDLVIEAYGNPPFMKLRAYKRIFGKVDEIEPDYVKVRGQKIAVPGEADVPPTKPMTI